jgi:hypothetical protein
MLPLVGAAILVATWAATRAPLPLPPAPRPLVTAPPAIAPPPPTTLAPTVIEAHVNDAKPRVEKHAPDLVGGKLVDPFARKGK